MLSQLRFKKFKSFAEATMSVEPITILIGANASGKSNAIDGLQILTGLATNRIMTIWRRPWYYHNSWKYQGRLYLCMLLKLFARMVIT